MSMMKSKAWILNRLLFFGFLLNFQFGFAQQQSIPIHHSYDIDFEKERLSTDEFIHTSFQPLLESRLTHTSLPTLSFPRSNKSWVSKKLFHEHFIQYDSSDVQFYIDPIVNFEYGIDNGASAREVTHYFNTRGFQLRLNLGDKISVQSSFRENQANLLSYVHNRTRRSREAFGQGRVKSFGEGGFDYNMASSAVSYSPNTHLNFQIGHGKHFIGQGHRSFLLSDLAFNYPFMRINSQWFGGKLSYQNLFALYQNIERLPSDFESEGLFQRNQAATHFLEYSPVKSLNLGLFESNIWKNTDTSNFNKAGVNYWVPIILLNSLFDKNTIATQLGLTANYTGFSRLNIYGQLATTALKDSAFNFQVGAKYYLKSIPLRVMVEYNSSNSFDGNYRHYESSLTHPVQSTFQEAIFGLTFKKNRIWSTLQLNYLESQKNELLFVEFRQSYVVNPSSRLALTAGIRYRELSPFQEETNYLFIGLTTNLQNLYFDY